ncbi:ComF family protein [Deinobacterium chartae]|uniref:ComF family protein n=1 Tax=Deinobacterium chartae TaxID=521158 RepID=A0A841HVS3_9DEIO|nr:double zinc ribbon domain-containing protein [Deinobacterium chartae]MBB6096764.1 ComF family protein [Deinobacterium chartae]
MSPHALPELLSGLLRALLPRACPACHRPLGSAAGLCADCLERYTGVVWRHSPLLEHTEPHLVTLGPYERGLRRASQALKYAGSRELAVAFAGPLAAAVPKSWQAQAVCAVPLHPSRQRQRGYNQSELLGRALAARLALPYLPLLVRTRATRQQARLRADQRAANVRDAFVCRATPPERVILTDDVLTTGSTLLACARALRAAGAREVFFVTVAR